MSETRNPDVEPSGAGGYASAGIGRVLLYAATILIVIVLFWATIQLLLLLSLVSFTLAASFLLTAILSPFAQWLRRRGTPSALAALISLLALVGFPTALGFLIWARTGQRLNDLTPALTQGIDNVRSWLITGPFSLDASTVAGFRDQLVMFINDSVPSPVDGARTAVHALTAVALALIAVFFFLKDGPTMWGWALDRAPARQRDRVDGAGRRAWSSLSGYVVGVTVIAFLDALFIGLGLFVIGVPFWLSLTLVTFFSAFVPILGATVSGAAATLVTLVTNGSGDAFIILGIVLAVQQIEGNLLQPLVMSRAVHLHPLVTLVAVTCGTLLLGVAGAVLAVPITAVVYAIAEYLRTERSTRGRSLPEADISSEPALDTAD